MTLGARVVLAFLALALIVFAWLFRIDAKPLSGGGTAAIVTNHWTGTVYGCNARPECVQIYP
jgi:hypothetical protein